MSAEPCGPARRHGRPCRFKRGGTTWHTAGEGFINVAGSALEHQHPAGRGPPTVHRYDAGSSPGPSVPTHSTRVDRVDEHAEDGGSSDAAGGLRDRRGVGVVSFWRVLAGSVALTEAGSMDMLARHAVLSTD